MSDVVRAWLDRARARADAAAHHVGRLCTKEDRWTMSVPARDDDSDILLTQVAEDAEAAGEALRAVLELHQPYRYRDSERDLCAECINDAETEGTTEWPCPTVKAITDALTSHQLPTPLGSSGKCEHTQRGITWAEGDTTCYVCETCEHEWTERD